MRISANGSSRQRFAKLSALALFLLAVSPVSPVHAAGGVLVVEIDLHLGGEDGIQVCQKAPFAAELGARTAADRAANVASGIAAALGQKDVEGRIEGPNSSCAEAILREPLAHLAFEDTRAFVFDTRTLASTATALGYTGFQVHVCGPETLHVAHIQGGYDTSDRCPFGYLFREPVQVDLRFFDGGAQGPAPRARTPKLGENVYVTIDIRATHRDAVLVCFDYDVDGASLGPAQAVATIVAEGLGLLDPTYRYDLGCIGVTPAAAIAQPAGEHERVYRFDTSDIEQRLSSSGFDTLFIDVCVPVLPHTFSTVGDTEQPDPGDCEFNGYSWLAPAAAEVRFSAGSRDFVRGLLIVSGGALAMLMLLCWFVAAVRRGHILWPGTRTVFTWIVAGLAAAAAAFGWPALSYDSGFVHATELTRGAGPGFEVAFLLTGSLSVAALFLFAIAASRRVVLRSHSELFADPGGAPEPFPADPRPASSRIKVVAVAFLFCAAAGSAAIIVLSPEIKIVPVLGVAVATALGLPRLMSTVYPRAYRAVRMEKEREGELCAELGALGTRVQRVYVSPAPLLLFRLGPYRPASPYVAGLVAFRRALVWRHAESLPVPWVAAALTSRRVGTEGVWPALVLTFAAAIVRGFELESVWWPFLAPLAAVAFAAGFPSVRRVRVGRRAPKPRDFVEGTLMFGRLEARLMAPRNMGSRLWPWRRAWLEARLRARRFAASAQVTDGFVEHAELEVMRSEYQLFADLLVSTAP